MPEQELNRTQVGARLEEMDRKACRSACGETGLAKRARRAATWQARPTAFRVIGFSGRSPGKSQCRGRSTCHQARRTSSSFGESIT